MLRLWNELFLSNRCSGRGWLSSLSLLSEILNSGSLTPEWTSASVTLASCQFSLFISSICLQLVCLCDLTDVKCRLLEACCKEATRAVNDRPLSSRSWAWFQFLTQLLFTASHRLSTMYVSASVCLSVLSVKGFNSQSRTLLLLSGKNWLETIWKFLALIWYF